MGLGKKKSLQTPELSFPLPSWHRENGAGLPEELGAENEGSQTERWGGLRKDTTEASELTQGPAEGTPGRELRLCYRIRTVQAYDSVVTDLGRSPAPMKGALTCAGPCVLTTPEASSCCRRRTLRTGWDKLERALGYWIRTGSAGTNTCGTNTDTAAAADGRTD